MFSEEENSKTWILTSPRAVQCVHEPVTASTPINNTWMRLINERSVRTAATCSAFKLETIQRTSPPIITKKTTRTAVFSQFLTVESMV